MLFTHALNNLPVQYYAITVGDKLRCAGFCDDVTFFIHVCTLALHVHTCTQIWSLHKCIITLTSTRALLQRGRGLEGWHCPVAVRVCRQCRFLVAAELLVYFQVPWPSASVGYWDWKSFYLCAYSGYILQLQNAYNDALEKAVTDLNTVKQFKSV